MGRPWLRIQSIPRPRLWLSLGGIGLRVSAPWVPIGRSFFRPGKQANHTILGERIRPITPPQVSHFLNIISILDVISVSPFWPADRRTGSP